ncbi:MAG: sporulation inhibitor of replication protein SirA [Bacillus sp. (in: firmicutes)]
MEKRNYQIYLIDENVRETYTGREYMFFNLFKEYSQSTGEKAWMIGKQILYITKNISAGGLKYTLEEQLHYNKNIYARNDIYYARTKGKNSKWKSNAKLEMKNRVLHLEAQGNYDAETIFFESIRKCGDGFLAIDLNHARYGWLKPIKHRNFI